MTKRILIGKIASAHGIKGDVKVLCYADDANLLFRDEGVFTDETTQKRVVLSPRAEPKRGLFIARVEGVEDRTQAERARNMAFYIDRDELPETDENTMYHSDLEGMNVVSEEGKPMGQVIKVQNFGAGDLLEIQGKKEIYYLPFTAPYLIRLDADTRSIVMIEPDVL